MLRWARTVRSAHQLRPQSAAGLPQCRGRRAARPTELLLPCSPSSAPSSAFSGQPVDVGTSAQTSSKGGEKQGAFRGTRAHARDFSEYLRSSYEEKSEHLQI